MYCLLTTTYLQTASHLPYNRNGFKFFTNSGGLGKADIKNILERAADVYKTFKDEDLRDTERRASPIRRVEYMTIYTSNLVHVVRKAAGNMGKNFLYICICEITLRIVDASIQTRFPFFDWYQTSFPILGFIFHTVSDQKQI